MEEIRATNAYVMSMNRAYRTLTVAVVTKFAALLTGIGRFKGSLALTDETASPQALAEGGILPFLAMADGVVSLLAIVFFCVWLARAAARRTVSLGKDALPRRMGGLCAAGVAASLLANLTSMGMTLVETGLLCRFVTSLPLSEAAMGTIRIPAEVPVLYLTLQGATLAVVSAFQLGVFLFFRALMRRTVTAADAPEPPASQPLPAGQGPDTGFGWPDRC